MWLLNEDRALKKKLQGLTVTDANAPATGRPVVVRFVEPEVEFADMAFPSILIERQSVTRDPSREHRGKTRLMYTPEQFPDWNPDVEDYNTSPYNVDFPVPYNLDYSVKAYTRKQPHAIALANALAQVEYLPARFGYLEIPEDGTIRRLDLEGGPEFEATKDGQGERVNITHYMLRVSTELLPAIADSAAQWTGTNIVIDYPLDSTT